MPVYNKKMNLRIPFANRFAISIAVLWLCPLDANADSALFSKADQAAEEGRLDDMLRFHEQILAEDPENVRALQGKAAALAWQNRFGEAQLVYQEALSREPDNVETRVGLGYAYAWNGQYSSAHTEFNRALSLNPTHIGARKGVALAYLWSCERNLALESLDIAANVAPKDAEIWEVAGYAHLENHNNRHAIESFDRALSLDPQRSAIRAARLEAYRAAPALEVFALAGSTSDADTGLRLLEVAHWPSRSTRVFLKFDDTIGLDNPSIANRGESAYGYFAGASHQLNQKVQLHLEGGVRRFVDGDLNSLTAKGVLGTSLGALTIGAQLGNHERGHSDSLVFGALRFAMADRWYFEPALYLSKTGADDDNEWRSVIGTEYRHSDRLAVGGFFGTGRVDTFQSAFSGTTNVVGAWVRREFDGPFALTLSARHEQTPIRDFSIVELGFQYRLPGNVGGAR